MENGNHLNRAPCSRLSKYPLFKQIDLVVKLMEGVTKSLQPRIEPTGSGIAGFRPA
jgi:hypothetical protein